MAMGKADDDSNPGRRIIALGILYLILTLLIALCFPETRDNRLIRPIVSVWIGLFGSPMPRLNILHMLAQFFTLISVAVVSHWLGFVIGGIVYKRREHKQGILETVAAVAGILGFVLTAFGLILQAI